jgi:hypothetical protein
MASATVQASKETKKLQAGAVPLQLTDPERQAQGACIDSGQIVNNLLAY